MLGNSPYISDDFYMSDYIEFTTKEKTRVWVKPEHICGVEEFSASARGEPYIKVYIPGFSFSLTETTADKFLQKISQSKITQK